MINKRLFSLAKSAFIFLGLFLIILAAAPTAAQGSQTAAVTMTAVVGFDGIYKGEFGVPVHVTVGNNGPAIEGQLQINLGSSAMGDRSVYAAPISLPTQSNKRLSLYLFLPTFTNRLTIELVDDRGQLIHSIETNTLTQLAADDLLYAVVEPEASKLGFLDSVTGDRANAAVAFLTLADLPEAAAAWNALDVVIFNDIDTGQLTAAQMEALEVWTGSGGQLVVTGGPGWQKSTAALAHLLPVTVNGSQSVDDLPALSAHAGVPFRDAGPYLVATSTLRNGELILHDDGLPLLARQQRGRGAVYFLALDPNLAPLRDWDGSPEVWGEIAHIVPRLPFWGSGAQNSYAAGSAIESLPSLALPSTLYLFLFLMAYVTIVGPVNYFVLRRLNRRELAWLTIPAIILFFSATAYLTGFQLKGNDVIINQMSIAYGQMNNNQMRVQTLVGLYSPHRATYDLIFPGNTLVRPFSRDSGSMIGGSRSGAISWGNNVVATDVRVDVSGIETFVADSYQPLPALEGQATLHLEGSQTRLDVTIQNNSDLHFENVNLLFGTAFIQLDDLGPGASQTISQRLTSVQATAAVGAASGSGSGGFGPVYMPASNSIFGSSYHQLLGTTDYYQDREAFPRFQLLESLSASYSRSGVNEWIPNGVVTLIGWSEERHLDVSLDTRRYSQIGTTLYFIEFPVSQMAASGRNVTIPQPLLTWHLLNESGMYNPAAVDLYMPYGWIEFEFQPWPEFQRMSVNKLEVVLQQAGNVSGSGPAALKVHLWDWQEEVWTVIENATWGSTAVSNPAPYIGPANSVRIRLQNDTGTTYEVRAIYPNMTGDLE